MLDNSIKRGIRGLMQDPRWNSFELALLDYMKTNFLDESYKRSNEFETMWNVAHSEGGKYHLNNFIKTLEEHANYD